MFNLSIFKKKPQAQSKIGRLVNAYSDKLQSVLSNNHVFSRDDLRLRSCISTEGKAHK